MRTLVTALLLAGAAVPASAEEWFYVADGGDGIVLADAVRTRPARSAGPPREAAAPALALGDGARGGAR